jgi:hypothetical protein
MQTARIVFFLALFSGLSVAAVNDPLSSILGVNSGVSSTYVNQAFADGMGWMRTDMSWRTVQANGMVHTGLSALKKGME